MSWRGLPLGYDRTPGQEEIWIDAGGAELVRRVFLHCASGATMREIAERMKERTGRAWYASTVKVILDNESIYRGGTVYWPAIL
jgi:hypothetical protein